MFPLESASGFFEILGIEGAEVGMPSDEFERSSGNEENTVMLPKVSLGTVEEQDAFGGIREGRNSQFTAGYYSSEYLWFWLEGLGRREGI